MIKKDFAGESENKPKQWKNFQSYPLLILMISTPIIAAQATTIGPNIRRERKKMFRTTSIKAEAVQSNE
jgi:hypothetical protein